MKELRNYIIAGAVFVLIFGTVSHFIYGWSGKNPIVGFLFPVNESTWEHMKLLFFPMLFYTLFAGININCIVTCISSALLLGIFLGSFLIPVIFYTYSGILGYNTLWLDIAVFALSVVFAFYAAYKLTISCRVYSKELGLKILIFLMAASFLVFTYYPPNIGLFANPV